VKTHHTTEDRIRVWDLGFGTSNGSSSVLVHPVQLMKWLGPFDCSCLRAVHVVCVCNGESDVQPVSHIKE